MTLNCMPKPTAICVLVSACFSTPFSADMTCSAQLVVVRRSENSRLRRARSAFSTSSMVKACFSAFTTSVARHGFTGGGVNGAKRVKGMKGVKESEGE
jgi:hypothetical protein